MSQDVDYFMKSRAKEVLKADKWRCKLCEEVIEGTGTYDVKDSILRDHLNTRHIESPLYNKNIKEEYKVNYFKPIIEIIQENVKYQ